MNDNSLATIISLKDVNSITGMRVTMDTSIEKDMHVVLRDGTVLKSKEFVLGLYYYDMASTNAHDSDK